MLLFIDNSDLLEVKEGIILHGCNAQGVMGSGVAKQVKHRYPEAYVDYLNLIGTGIGESGEVLGKTVVTQVTSKLFIASGITQEFYGREPGVQYVSYSALYSVVSFCLAKAAYEEAQLHIPHMIGAGLGGGDYTKIKTLLEDLSDAYCTQIYCHIKY